MGSPPNLSPAGDPSGDEIYLPAYAEGEYPSPAIVVTATGFSSNALRYSNIDIPYLWRYLGFLSADRDPSATGYTATWSGRLNLPENASALDVWFGDSHFGELASIRFDNGHVYLKTGISGPSFEDMGTYVNNQNHSILISINKDEGTYALSVLQTGGEDLHSDTRPVLRRESLETTNPTVYFWFSEDGVSSSGTYTVDDVIITETLPDSAAPSRISLPDRW